MWEPHIPQTGLSQSNNIYLRSISYCPPIFIWVSLTISPVQVFKLKLLCVFHEYLVFRMMHKRFLAHSVASILNQIYDDNDEDDNYTFTKAYVNCPEMVWKWQILPANPPSSQYCLKSTLLWFRWKPNPRFRLFAMNPTKYRFRGETAPGDRCCDRELAG
jgi:hypothetical protein